MSDQTPSYDTFNRKLQQFKDEQAQTPQQPSPHGDEGRLDVGKYLSHYGIEYKPKPNGEWNRYCLSRCVFDPSHSGGEASIGQHVTGKLSYQCFHNSCKGKTWAEARRIISGEDKLGDFMVGGNNQSKPDPKKPRVVGLGFSELKATFSEKAVYLWKSRIAKAMPSAITGTPGVGKTSIAAAITKQVLEQYPEGMGIWVSTEGQTQDTFIKVGEQGGPLLDSNRFVLARHENGSFMFNFHHEAERKALDEFMGSLPKPVLIVVIDSLRGASENIDENSKVMGDMMNRLQSYICDKHRAACLWIHHWNKRRNIPDAERISGNTAISGALRAVFSVTQTSELVRTLSLSKRNLTDIATEPLRVIKSPDGFLFYEEALSEASLLKKAERWLIELFQERKIRYVKDEIYDSSETKKLGLKEGILKAAKRHLPIVVYQEAGPGTPWIWEWKESYSGVEPLTLGENGKNDEKKPNEITKRHESHENLQDSKKSPRDNRVMRDNSEKKSDSKKNINKNNERHTTTTAHIEQEEEKSALDPDIQALDVDNIPSEGFDL